MELFLCSFSFLYLVAVTSTHARIVQIKQGVLTGTINTARNGRLFNSYFGIPYAQPPVGKLRFQPPEEALPWTGVWNASSAPEECIQIVRNSDNVTGVEDCLYLNIHTPHNSKPGDNIPVILLIHGGSFRTGSNTREGPEYIMGLGSVIMVQPNYRLGLFGLLSTGDAVVPGNMALKDQSMSMKWTKQNIYAFGGDPNKLTIVGHSSGAICVSLHTLSPLSHGLFERAIILSGSSFNPIAVFTRTITKSVANELAQIAGCGFNSSREILECFLKMDGPTVLNVQQKLKLSAFGATTTIRPVIEDKTIKNAFLTEYPIKGQYPSTSVQWMMGHTSSEAAENVAEFLSDDGQTIQKLSSEYNEQMPILTAILWSSKPAHINYITQIIRTHYLGNKSISSDADIELTNMLSNVIYNFPITRTIKSYRGSRFAYLYDYKSNFSTQLYKASYKKYLGVAHVDDLQLLFQREESKDSLSPRDIAFGDEMLKRWANFAYSGNPNKPYPINESMFSAWDLVTSDRVEYLRIKLNGTMETDLDKESYSFLNSLPWFSGLL